MNGRTHTAAEIERRIEPIINAMWNSTNPKTRYSIRRAFFWVKPNVVDFLVNGSFMLMESKKDPEA